MIISNLFSFLIGIFFTVLGNRIVSANKSFIQIINNFVKKLPPEEKKAKQLNSNLPMALINLTPYKPGFNQIDLDAFMKELEDFDYSSLILQKKKTISLASDLKRLLRRQNDNGLSLVIIQEILEDHTKRPYLFGYKASKFIGF